MARRKFLLVELKRRNVWRAALLYAGAAWALAQGIAQLAPFVGLPNRAVRWFNVAAVIGFPFWIVFAWFYEITPGGLKRDSNAGETDPAFRRATGRKLDRWIVAVLALAVVLLAAGYFFRGKQATTATAAFKPPANSIVVLPFKNLSGDPKQAYFSNGITEELTGALGQDTGLTVIAWETASRYGGGKQTPEQIGT